MRSLFNIFYFLLYFRFEAISKLLKIVKAPSLRSDKGSVFGCYLTGSNLKLPFTALCEWHLCHFLNDF